MPLDPLGPAGGVFLITLGLLVLVGLFTRPAALLLALQCVVAYFYAAASRGPWPIRNGGIDTLTYVFVFIYFAGAGAGAWSLDALFGKKKSAAIV